MATKFLPTIVGRSLTYFGGAGYIAGLSPGIVTVSSTPAARQVEVRHRSTRVVMFVTFSAPDGTYRVDGLDPAEEYDLIGRDWTGTYNDVIWARVRPVPYAIQSLSGAFDVNDAANTLEGAIAIVGGDAHVVSVSSGAQPPGISFAVVVGTLPQFDHAGFWLVASGSTVAGVYSWDLTVTAANGTQRTIACSATFT